MEKYSKNEIIPDGLLSKDEWDFNDCHTLDEMDEKLSKQIDNHILDRLRLEVRKDKFAERLNKLIGYGR